MTHRLWQFPGVANHEPMPAIEIRQSSLGGYIVLIIENLLAKKRVAIKPESNGAKRVGSLVNGFGKGISRQELKAVAQSLIDCCLQRVVVRIPTTF